MAARIAGDARAAVEILICTPRESNSLPNKKSVKVVRVEDYLEALDHPFKVGVQSLRRVILRTDPRIKEAVKWNAPSFYISEHFATFRLHPSPALQLILHIGAERKSQPKRFEVADPDGLLKWAAPDRCILTFTSIADASSKSLALRRILKAWIRQL